MPVLQLQRLFKPLIQQFARQCISYGYRCLWINLYMMPLELVLCCILLPAYNAFKVCSLPYIMLLFQIIIFNQILFPTKYIVFI